MSAMTHRMLIRITRLTLGAALLASASLAIAQPTFGNPSPTAGSSTSQKANASADQALYKPVEYTNVEQEGPGAGRHSRGDQEQQRDVPAEVHDEQHRRLRRNRVVGRQLPGARALESGPVLNEFALAYNLGDPDAARKLLKMGKLKSTKYVVKFDILKTEQVAAAQSGFDGRAIGNVVGLLGIYGGSRGAAQAGTAAGAAIGSVHTGESSGVWIIGMRYKIINAETTEQVAQGYTEEKMEVGAKSTSVLGVSESQQGGVSLDTMVQRLVQKSVWEIDNKYK